MCPLCAHHVCVDYATMMGPRWPTVERGAGSRQLAAVTQTKFSRLLLLATLCTHPHCSHGSRHLLPGAVCHRHQLQRCDRSSALRPDHTTPQAGCCCKPRLLLKPRPSQAAWDRATPKQARRYDKTRAHHPIAPPQALATAATNNVNATAEALSAAFAEGGTKATTSAQATASSLAQGGSTAQATASAWSQAIANIVGRGDAKAAATALAAAENSGSQPIKDLTARAFADATASALGANATAAATAIAATYNKGGSYALATAKALSDAAQKDCAPVAQAVAQATAIADSAGWSKAFALSAAEAIASYPVLLCAAPRGSATATAIVRRA